MKISKSKKITLTFISLVFMMMIVISFHNFISIKENEYNECHAGYNFNNNNSEIHLDMYLVMSKEHIAHLSVLGLVKDNGLNHMISRYYTFNYEKLSERRYKLKNITLSKHISDNANSIMIPSSLFDLDTNSTAVINVTKLMNGYVIGDLYSPIFICINRD